MKSEKQNMEHLRRVYKHSNDETKAALDYLGAEQVIQTWARLKKLDCPTPQTVIQSTGEQLGS